MDNTNSNNPTDPNSTNPFNPTPPTTDPMNANPVANQTMPQPDLSSAPITPDPSFPVAPAVPTAAPTDPSSFLNNSAPATTTPTWDQNLANTPPPAMPNIDQPVTPQDPSMSNPAPAFNPTPALNPIPDPNFQTMPTPPAPATLNMGGLGSTNSQFGIPTPQSTPTPDLTIPVAPPPTTPPPAPEAPALDPNQIVQPLSMTPDINNNTTPSTPPSANTYNPMIPETEAPKTGEPAPTDLSHLIDPAMNINANSQVYTPSLSQQPETLVVPGNGEVSAAPTTSTSSSHIPKWVIGLGIVLFLVVAGASAYFILGLGQNVPDPASLPAQQSELQAPPQTLPSLPNSQPTTGNPPADTGSFGDLSSATPSATPAATASASPRSAADLLRQNQQSQ